MGLRLYLCPVVGDGISTETARRPKLWDVVGNARAINRANPDGTPKFPWALAVARSAVWAVADLDSTLERLFGIDLPDTVDTWLEMKAFLQSKTVGDIPAARQQALNTRLTNKGIDTSQITLQTTWWQVFRGIVRHMNDGVLPAGDGLGI